MTTTDTTMTVSVNGSDPLSPEEFLDGVTDIIRARNPIVGEVKVTANALLPALKAVLPHVESNLELPERRRIRIDVGDGLLVWTTDGYTGAIVRVTEDHLDEYDGAIWSLDLLPEDARLLIDMFTPGKDETISLAIETGPDTVTIADVTGLFPGREVTVPLAGGGEGMPALPQMMATWLAKRPTAKGGQGEWTLNPVLTARFTKSAAVFKSASSRTSQLVVEAGDGKTPLLIRIGEGFLGVLMPIRMSGDDQTESADRRRAWVDLLPTAQ